MSAILTLVRKEFTEISRTWRLPAVGGVLLFFAVTSPIAALMTPAIIDMVVSGQPGVVIEVPDPSYIDSYAQWVKNLSQIGMLLVVFSSAGLIAGERTSGTAALVVTKPVSRMAFAAAKFAAQAALVAVSAAVGTAVTYAGTVLAFGSSPVRPLLVASASWLVLALVAVALTEMLSAVLPAIAAGVGGLVIWGLGGLLSLLPFAGYTPLALLGAPSAALAGRSVPLAVPVFTSLLLTVALVWAAGSLFGRREL